MTGQRDPAVDDDEVPSPAEEEPEELTFEVNQSIAEVMATTKTWMTAKKRMSTAIKARGFLKTGSRNATGAARRDGESIEDVN